MRLSGLSADANGWRRNTGMCDQRARRRSWSVNSETSRWRSLLLYRPRAGWLPDGPGTPRRTGVLRLLGRTASGTHTVPMPLNARRSIAPPSAQASDLRAAELRAGSSWPPIRILDLIQSGLRGGIGVVQN